MPVIAQEQVVDVVAGDGVLWAYRRVQADGDKPESCRIAFGKPASDTRISWAPKLADRQLVGQIQAAAVPGNELHVFFSDGSFRVYSLKSMAGIGTAQSLGDNAKPLAVATDHTSQTICAIVPIEIARTAATREADRQKRINQLHQPDPSDEPSESEEESSEPPLWPEASHAVVKFQTGRWIPDRPFPPGWFADDSVIHLAAWKERLHVVWSTNDSAEPRYSVGSAPDKDWSVPTPMLPLAKTTRILDLLNHGDVVYSVIEVGNRQYTLAEHKDGKWIAAKPFSIMGQPFQHKHTDVAFTITTANGIPRVVGVWSDNKGFVQSTMWPMTGGDAVADVVFVSQLGPSSEPIRRNWRRQALPFVVLAGILGVLYWRRKTAVTTTIVIPAQFRLASNSRRLAAFSLDVAITMPVIAACLGPVIASASEEATLINRAVFGDDYFAALMSRWFLATAFFVVYTIVFELLWSATPGKRIMRCRVITESGQPVPKPRIVLRNVLKLLEFYPDVIATLVLVLLTRSRQRLGDLLARTIVVEHADPDDQRNDNG